MNKALKNVKQLFAASCFEIQNPFEFLRQQQEDWTKDPEIMQFKSSQKLINNYQPNPIQKSLAQGLLF
uniref:Uncharacterized protein n=1 Tax=Panagrolaimus davidi TaxID=227884 RepID=A0A914P9M4_9BILA